MLAATAVGAPGGGAVGGLFGRATPALLDGPLANKDFLYAAPWFLGLAGQVVQGRHQDCA
jgi:hypothetical protein